MSSRPKWYLGCAILSGILAIAMLALGIFSIATLPGMLSTQAAEKSMLKSDSYNQWGQVPGEFGVDIARTYTFFNFTNPFEVFFFNETPQFVQTKGYVYQEYQNLLNTTYSSGNGDDDDSTVVDFNYQQYMLSRNARNASSDDLIQTLNLGPLGFWYTAHRLPDYQFATYTLGQLVTSLELDIPTTLQSSAIKFQCLTNQQTTNDFLNKAGITDPDILDLIWNDPVNGLATAGTLPYWVHAIAHGPQSGSAKILGDYFYLNSSQVNLLFRSNGQLATCVSGLNISIQNAYSCDTNPCDPHYLVTLQLSSQGVTLHPAGGAVQPEDSVTFFNRTAVGYPEISLYLTKYFIPTYNVSPDDYDITFPMNITTNLLNYSASEGSKYNTNQDTLLNVGNIMFMYQVGEAFDQKGNLTNLTLLEPISARFGLSSLQHAHVLYKYVQYLEQEFAEKRSLKGGKGQLSIGQFASAALYENFIGASDFVLQDLTARLILKSMATNKMNCIDLLVNSTSGLLSTDSASQICASDHIAPFGTDSLKFFIEACNNEGGPEYTTMTDQLGFTRAEISIFCGSATDQTFLGMLQYSQSYLKLNYNCSVAFKSSGRCSAHEIAVLQWSSSVITQNIPPLLQGDFKTALSFSDWYPELFPKPFEYYAVLNKLSKKFNASDIQPMDYGTANKLLTFDVLFSQTQIQNAILFFENQSWDDFATAFFNVTPYPLVTYIRYIMIEVAMGGLAQTRTVNDLLWGYNDPFLLQIKNANPILAGDPSLNPFVNLAGQNSSADGASAYPVSMYTGTNDSTLTRKIITYFNESIITFPDAYFDGSDVIPVNTNPWRENISFVGTDGAVNHPGLSTSDVVDLYISDINFQTQLSYSQVTDVKNGLDTYRYTLVPKALSNSSNNPDNDKWFFDKWDGVINISKIHKAPLFVCKGHFYGADQTLFNAVEMYSDENKTKNISPSADDELYIDIEPYSGVAIGVSANLQVNYEFTQDDLFTNPNYALLPIVITSRTMSFSDSQVRTSSFCNLLINID